MKRNTKHLRELVLTSIVAGMLIFRMDFVTVMASSAESTESSGLTITQIAGVLIAVAGVVFLLIRRNANQKQDSNTKAPKTKKEGFKIPGKENTAKKEKTEKEKAAQTEKSKIKLPGFKKPADESQKSIAPENDSNEIKGINSDINNKYLTIPEGDSYSPKVGYTVDLNSSRKQNRNPYAQAAVQPAAPGLWITAVSGPLLNLAVPIKDGLTIGRGAGNTIAFPEYSGEVSHNHAKIMYVNGMLSLIDTNSANGTFLVGSGQINPMQAYAIGEGSTFYIGCDKNGFQIVRGQ